MPARRPLLARLMRRLGPQVDAAGGEAVVVPLENDGPTIGHVRQRMVEACRTPWLCFVDDDDLVSADYLPRVLAGVRAGADVVGFLLRHYVDGTYRGVSVHSVRCGAWRAEPDGDAVRYYRTPNHLNPVRRELALDVGYRPLRTGEDADYSRRLYRRHGHRLREWFCNGVLYAYLFRSDK